MKVYFSPKSLIISNVNDPLPTVGVYTYDSAKYDFTKMRTRSDSQIVISEKLKPKLVNPKKGDFPIQFQVQATASYENFKVYHFENTQSKEIENQCDIGLEKLSVNGASRNKLASFNIGDKIDIIVTNFRNLGTGKPAPEFLGVIRKNTKMVHLVRNEIAVRESSETYEFILRSLSTSFESH